MASVLGAYLTLLLIIPPGLQAASATKRQPATGATTLAAFAERLQKEGEVTQFPPLLVKLMGFPPGSKEKGFELLAAGTTDGEDRIADVVFSDGPTDGEAVAKGLYWTTVVHTKGKAITYMYRTGLDGALEKAVRIDGKRDENGNPIHGAGKLTELDIHSTEVRERFEREVLDFWLKGVGRKKPTPKPKTTK